MNILVISKSGSTSTSITGGQIVNHYIYNRFREAGHNVTFSIELFGFKSNIDLLLKLISHIPTISKYDHVIMDSSTYTKTLPMVMLFKLFYGSKKLSCIHHHFLYMMISGWRKHLYKWMEFTFLKQFGHVILVSPYILNICKSFLPHDKIHFCQLAFDKTLPAETEKVPNTILYVGTIEERKGLIYLVEGFKYLSPELRSKITVNIIGKVVEPYYKQKLDNMIEDLGLTEIFKFHGHVSEDVLLQQYSQSQIFAFPSLLEGYGMVLIEAMKYRLPVVCFNNTAMPYTVKTNHNGIVVTNKSSFELGNAIETLLTNHELYKKMSDGAYTTFLNTRSYSDLNKDIDGFIKKLIE